MNRFGRPTTAVRSRRGARTVVRSAALAVLVALVTLLAAPGTASAATGYRSAADSTATRLTPVLNCVVPGRNGAYQAVLGYTNPTRTTYYLSGSVNAISPSQYNGSQPRSFTTGDHDGVFSLSITSGTVTWSLNGASISLTSSAAPTCPAGTTLPSDGNGTGIAVALVAAGAVGVLLVRRARRTSARLASPAA